MQLCILSYMAVHSLWTANVAETCRCLANPIFYFCHQSCRENEGGSIEIYSDNIDVFAVFLTTNALKRQYSLVL